MWSYSLSAPRWSGRCGLPEPSEHRLGNPVQLVQADEGINLGDLGSELGGVALRHAPRHDQAAQTAAVLPLRDLKDGVDGLALGILDEPARVYDHDLGVAGVDHDPSTPLRQVAEHDLPVHQVLGAPEPYHADLDGIRCARGARGPFHGERF